MRESEEAFLGCILIDPSLTFKSKLTEQHFLHPKSRRLFRAMQKCVASGIKIDYISVTDSDKEIDPSYPVELHDRIPSSANWKHYEKEIITAFQRYRLSKLGRELSSIEVDADPVKYIERAESELFTISTNCANNTIQPIKDILPTTMKKIEERYNLKGKLPGIACGLPGLDYFTGGLQDDRYYIIGARPSDGKSALMLNMACHIAIRDSLPVGIISAESSGIELCTRALSSEGNIDGRKLNYGFLKLADFNTMLDVGERIKTAPLFVYDVPNIPFTELKSIARQLVLVHGAKALFVDYLQIIQWEDNSIPFHERVRNISLGLKGLARELRIPVVALAQLRRDAEGREPEMADLADSSQVEKDADSLIFIYHPKNQEEDRKPSRLLIKKNRDGPKGDLPVVFKREYVRFYESEATNG